MKVLVVYKKSALEIYKDQGDEALQLFLKTQSKERDEILSSHDIQLKSRDQVVDQLAHLGVAFDMRYRALLDQSSDLHEFGLIVALGGDGTFLEVARYIPHDSMLLGVNSDPKKSLGFYSHVFAENLWEVIANVEKEPRTTLNRLELTLNGLILPEHPLNDVLIAHYIAASTTRYCLKVKGIEKVLRNSGLLVYAPGGSTAWADNVGARILPKHSNQLGYVTLGEWWTLKGITSEIGVHSHTRQGTLFIDGEHCRYGFGLGSEVNIKGGTKPLTYIGDIEEKRRLYRKPLFKRAMRRVLYH